MNENKIYYYISPDGVYHFSTGAIREGEKAEQYLRMLRFARRQVVLLRPDIPDDAQKISTLFNVQP